MMTVMQSLLRRLQQDVFRHIPYFGIVQLVRPKSYLHRIGWLRSVRKGLSVSEEDQPIPWYTYAAVAFLKDRVKPEWSVFEYGSGHSTLWWAGLVPAGKVIACEHEAGWCGKLRRRLPGNAELHHQALEPEGKYGGFIAKYHNQFHVVVIDGRQRVSCALHCLGALRADGVVVWDNSDRSDYGRGLAFLRERGFRQLDFTGMGPISPVGWSTSILYRPHNCLGI